MDRFKDTDLNSDDVVSPPPPLGVDLNLRKPNAPSGILSLDEGESGRLSLLLLSSNSSKTSSVNPSSFASIRDETRGGDGEVSGKPKLKNRCLVKNRTIALMNVPY